jgi:mono/diheme cytochrome c family protein
MLSKKANFGMFIGVISIGFFTLGGCSKDDDDPAPTNTSTKTYTLSASFATNCAGCHGSSGQGISGPKLQAYSKGEAAFTAVVRGGKGNMPAFTAEKYSDATIKSDLAELTK